jgi:group I intron endonuclease
MKKYTYSCINEIKPIQIFTKLNIEANLKACEDQLKGKSGIYGIINLVSNKLYIGKSINIPKRFKQHIKKTHNTSLRNAINKNGLHNFAFVVFVFVPSQNKFYIKKELTRLEPEYIKNYEPDQLYNEPTKLKNMINKNDPEGKIYNKNKAKLSLGKYKTELDLTIKSFIKALTHNQFGLNSNELSTSQIKDLITKKQKDYFISVKDIYNIKSRKSLINNSVPKTPEGLEFINNIKKEFPDFKEDLF